MAQMIVTVKVQPEGKQYDLEVPDDVEVYKLMDDIYETLLCLNLWNHNAISSAKLFSIRQNRVLDDTTTLEAAGVWNGDILLL